METFSRTRLLIGDGVDELNRASVAVFGVGGVGGFVIEALARSGIGKLMIADYDVVSQSNINRQIIALNSTVGLLKTDVMKARLMDINPSLEVDARAVRYCEETASEFDFSRYDYIVDAIDSVTSKLLIIERAKAAGVPIISCMGAGNKLDPSAFKIADIERTSICPLARVMRRDLKKRGISGVKVLFSTEPAIAPQATEGSSRPPTGSIAFVPSTAGLLIASEVVHDLLKKHSQNDKIGG